MTYSFLSAASGSARWRASNGTIVRAISVLACGVCTTGNGRCQVALATFNGSTPGEAHAFVARLGDVSQDGVPDFAIGTPWRAAGQVEIHSGATLEVLATLTGQAPGDGFGLAVAPAGDLSGNGRPTLVVGAPWHDSAGKADSGRAYVYELRSSGWMLLDTIEGESAGDELGRSVAGAGDVDGDGRDDVIVGAPLRASQRGSAYVYGYSATGAWTQLGVLNGTAAGDEFGTSVWVAGDVDVDARADVVIGAPGHSSGAGSAHVWGLGATGWTELRALQDDPSSLFGTVVRAAYLDSDTVPDLIVGAPEDDDGGSDAGSVIVFSGLSGSVLYEAKGSGGLGFYYGYAVDVVEDLSGDGVADLVIGIPEAKPNDTGAARISSGASGATLFTLTGDAAADGFGETVAGLGDITGDGHPEVLVGAPQDPSAQQDPGYARLFTGWGEIGTNLCGPANLNSSGQPAVIHALGSLLVVKNDVTLAAVQLPPNQFGYFLNSLTTGTSFPPGSQGKLCLAGGIGRYNKDVESTGAGGAITLGLDLTQTPTPNGPVAIQSGETWYFQCWFRDKNPNPTSNFTDGIELGFQ